MANSTWEQDVYYARRAIEEILEILKKLLEQKNIIEGDK